MKRLILFLTLVFVCINAQGQSFSMERLIGVVDMDYMPDSDSMIFVFRGSFSTYTIIQNSHCISIKDKLIIEGNQYKIGDRVSITEALLTIKDSTLRLEIKAMKRFNSTLTGSFLEMEGQYKITCFRQHETYERALLVRRYPNNTDSPNAPDLILWSLNSLDWFVFSFANMLNDNSFILESKEVEDFVGLKGGVTWGEGYVKNDSIFIMNKNYRPDNLSIESYECICAKGEISSTSSTPNYNKVQVYYNAAGQSIVIDLAQTFLNKNLTFELFDMQGRILLKKTFSGNHKINVSYLPKGVYLYRLSQGNEILSSGKILK
jgi:hypothetical protein